MSVEPWPVPWPHPSVRRGLAYVVAYTAPVVALLIGWGFFASRVSYDLWVPAGVVALALCAAWLYFSSRALPRWERSLRAGRVARGVPPWRADRHWGAGGRTRSATYRAGTHVWAVVLGVLPFSGLFRGDAIRWLLAGLALVATIVTVRAWLRGRVEVRWDAVPVPVGSRARFALSMTAGSSALAGAFVRLRCVRTTELTVNARPAPIVLVRFNALPGARMAIDSEGEAIFEFEIPADAPGTDLRSPAPTHWEIVVLGRSAWGEFADAVVVPVYAVPAA